jgi:hypothetical protein
MKGRNGYTVWVEVNEIPVVRHGKTVAIAGSIEDITEKVHVDVGLAEAEDLLKISAARRKEVHGHGTRSPFGFLKSLFSREPEDESDRQFEIPKNLK